MRDSIAFADSESSTLSAMDRDAFRHRTLIESEVDWVSTAVRGRFAEDVPSGRYIRPIVVDGEVGATGVAHLDSFAALKRWAKSHFPWLNLSNRCGDAFAAQVTLYRVGTSLFLTLRSDACEATRSPHLAYGSHTGLVKVMWPLSGRIEVEQDGRSFGLEQGQVGVCDTSRPYRMRMAARTSVAVLLLPHDTFSGWQQLGSSVCGRSIRQSIATRAALAALMSLNNLPVAVVAGQGGPVLSAVRWMLCNALLHGETGSGESEAYCGALIAKARQHIVEHIADPTLSPDDVASALCMSRRSLYLLFKAHRLTPSRLIHDLRLNQVKRALEDPAQAHQKMTHIALDAGFADYATFSRLFKTHFGVTPSEFRSRHRLALCA